MASKFANIDTTDEHTYFSRVCRMIVDLCRDMLWELLISKIPAKDLPRLVSLHRGNLKLNADQYQKIYQQGTSVPINTDVDISSLYTILRNICPKIKPPSKGWMDERKQNFPNANDLKMGDDIERIRRIRNAIFGHAVESKLSKAEYQSNVVEIRAIVRRMDSRLQIKTKFFKYMDILEKCCMDPENEREYIEQLLVQKREEEKTIQMVEQCIGGVRALESEHAKTETTISKLAGELEEVTMATSVNTDLIFETSKELHTTRTDVQHNTENIKTVENNQGFIKKDSKQLKEKIKHIEKQQTKLQDTKPNIQIVQNINSPVVTAEREIDGASNECCFRNSPKTTKRRSYAEMAANRKDTKESTRVTVSNIHTVINVHQCTQPTAEQNAHIQFKGPEFETFLKNTNNFKDGNFILLANDVERQKYLEALALVPWTAVFDFDPYSRTKGLLSVLQHTIPKYGRALKINCIEDSKISNVKENSTHWMFCRGCRENSTTKHSYDFRDWKQDDQVNTGMKAFLKNLKKFSRIYTRYRVIVLWPKEISVYDFFYRLLEKLQKNIEPQVILVHHESNKLENEESVTFRKMIKHSFREMFSTVNLSLKDVCNAVSSSIGTTSTPLYSSYKLPTADKTNNLNIEAQEANWLEEDMTVLYVNKMEEMPEMKPKQLREECDNFFKGGTLPWKMWYEVNAGHVDATRSCLDDIKRSIQENYLNVYRTGMIQIFHAPGSGGTTLAQRILWDFMQVTPCAQVKLRANSTVDDLVSRLEFLHEKTGMPILLMLDGEDEQRVDDLVRRVRKPSVVFLHVKRYLYSMAKCSNTNCIFWLKSTVTVKEANSLALKFGNQVNTEEKKTAIDQLAKDVHEKKERCIFEFGLAAYEHQFKGIESYVKGYLKLPEDKTERLKPWHNALVMLSLAYYYGQIGIPCFFFSEMISQKGSKATTVPRISDFPENMQNLVVKDTSENKTNIVRISHYYVAKEILEQLVPWPLSRDEERKQDICISNKAQMEAAVVRFIKHAELKDNKEHSMNVIKILTRTFIIRDHRVYNSADGSEYVKIEHVSRIFQDLSCRLPYTEMFNVMKQLTKSFPNDPHFFAHLGRIYAIFKPEAEEEAEKCFETALTLCKSQTQGQNFESMPFHMRLTFTITYYMYGNMYRSRVTQFTGKKPNRKRTISGQFEEVANKLLDLVHTARKNYNQSRQYDPDLSSHNHSYVSEIHLCLMFCDFVRRRGGFKDILQFIAEHTSAVSEFAEECIYQIDDLFLEFFSSQNPDNFDEPQIAKYQSWYKSLFQNETLLPGRVIARKDSITARRIEIAKLKLQAGNNKLYGMLEDIDNETSINKIVDLYEDNFTDVHERGMEVTKVILEQDYKEWMIAIRHKLIHDPYSIETVLKHVQRWNEKTNTPHSKFYLFVLKSLLGFGCENAMGNTHLLIEAQQLKQEVISQTRFLAKLKLPKEWLGTGNEIKQLLAGPRFFGQVQNKECIVNPENLALMKGTIRHPNDNARVGYISLDLGKENNVPVHVFFIPINFKLQFTSYAQTRVEFNIGLTYAHGYEAFNVKRLEMVKCSKCNMMLERTTRDQTVRCECGNSVDMK